MLLLVGLGNPGPKYERNRHNIGFMAADAIARRHGFGPFRARFRSLCAEGTLGGEKVLLMKPTTFMNESGRAVGEAVRFFKLGPADVVVVHDELDLVPAKVRVKTGGGVAGHNGLRSIKAHIGPDFVRVRVGIGHPGDKARVHGYVLSDFAKAEWPAMERTVDAIAECAPLLARNDANAFMTRVALLVKPPQKRESRTPSAAATDPAAPDPARED